MKTLSSSATFVDILRERAATQSHQKAYTFLVDGKVEGSHITYAELDRKARALGAWLQQQQARDERVMLLYPQGLEVIAAFLGCLYGGAIAIPAPAPEASRLKRTLPRLQAIAKDARAKFVLTTAAIVALVEEHSKQFPELRAMTWIDSEQVPLDMAATWIDLNLTADRLAYLQYTSGSTSTPKGVAIGHDNLTFHSAYLQRACGYTSESVTVTWMPYFHDYGLVEGLMQPLFNGTPCYVMSPFSFIKRPIHWLQAISRYRGTHSQAPNFAYDQCIRRISPEARAGLDLASWQAAGNAAEPINPNVLDNFYKAFAPFGFRWNAFSPAYGLAENTLLASFSPQSNEPVVSHLDAAALEQNRIVDASEHSKLTRTIAGCGRLVCETQVAIVDPNTKERCAPDRVGEIWISDPSVARGYWQRPEDTEQTFHAYTADTREGPFLRTGDLGFIKDGELFVSGRIKDVVIIRGTNHYPQDIEWTVQASHSVLRAEHGAAFSVNIDGEEKLVIAQEIERKQQKSLDSERVIEIIREAVAAQHELEVYGVLLLKPGSILKTSSGKIQRQACRAGFLDDSLNAIASWRAATEETNISHLKSTAESSTMSANGRVYSVASAIAPPPSQNARSQARADDIIHWLRDYGRDRVNSRLIDERRCIPPHIVLDLGNRGVLGMQIPQRFGGNELGHRDSMRVVEQLAAIDLTLATFVVNNEFLGIRPIQQHATPTLQNELLPLLAGGRELAAFALTEPAAGSNPQAIAATGMARAGGGWSLSGTKVWSGSAAWAGAINVFVKLLDDRGKPEGITGFTLRQGMPGLHTGAESLTMGMRGMVQNYVHLDDVPVDAVHLLSAPGTGMVAAQDGMLYTRLAIGAMCVGGLKRCAQLMLRYASRRAIGTGRLLDNPVTLTRISHVTAATTAFDTLVARIADLLDRGAFVPTEAYVACKTAGPEFLWQSADTLVQLLGGRGYIETNIAAQILRDARIFRTFEGPTETLTMFLGSRTLHQHDELHRFLSDSLGAPAVSERLRDAAARIHERWSQATEPFSDPPTALRWASTLVGEIATHAILLAALQGAARSQIASAQRERAAAWVEQQFEQSLAKALGDRAMESVVLSARDADALVSSYTETIGDVEQTCAGEERELDGFLRQQPGSISRASQDIVLPGSVAAEDTMIPHASESKSVAESDPPADLETVAASTLTDRSVESLEAWLVEWISRELKTEIATVNSQKSFVHYGLDSVTAIMLVSDLEVRIGRELPPALAWSYPIIRDLARYLADELESVPSEEDAGQNGQFDTQKTNGSDSGRAELLNVDRLSDAEVDAMLAQLLAEGGVKS
ncbi:MAG: AMP-binding protein [Cyanobacteria bacterium J06642_2]